MTDVTVDELTAELAETRPVLDRMIPPAPELPDLVRTIRETTARDAWRAARLSAD